MNILVTLASLPPKTTCSNGTKASRGDLQGSSNPGKIQFQKLQLQIETYKIMLNERETDKKMN